ncbi:MAG: hypothetical protein AAF203_00290 [Pseudomonadota bacterium]
MILPFFLSILLAKEMQNPKSPLQLMLEKEQNIRTKEGPVSINGMTYQKIEAEGKSYYFKVLKKDKPIPIFLCEPPGGFQSERLLEASLKVGGRKRVFFQGLVERCSMADPKTGVRTNSKRTWVEVDPMIGIHIPGQKDDRIQNKKLGVKPREILGDHPKLHFMGEF